MRGDPGIHPVIELLTVGTIRRPSWRRRTVGILCAHIIKKEVGVCIDVGCEVVSFERSSSQHGGSGNPYWPIVDGAKIIGRSRPIGGVTDSCALGGSGDFKVKGGIKEATVHIEGGITHKTCCGSPIGSTRRRHLQVAVFQTIRVKPVGNALLLLGVSCRVFTQHGEAILSVISSQAEVFPTGSELEVGVPFITRAKAVLTGGEDHQKPPWLQDDCGQCPLVGYLPVISQVMPGKANGRGSRVPQFNPVRPLSIRVQAGAIIVSHELTDEQVIKCRHGRGAIGIIRVVTEAYLLPVFVAVAVTVGHQRVGAVGKDLLPVIKFIAVGISDHRVGGGIPVDLLSVIEPVAVTVGKDRAGAVLVKLRGVGKPVAVTVGKVRVRIEVEFLAVDEPVVIGIIPAGLAKIGEMGQLPGVGQRVSIRVIGYVYPVLEGDVVHLHGGLLIGCRQLQGKIGVGLVGRG